MSRKKGKEIYSSITGSWPCSICGQIKTTEDLHKHPFPAVDRVDEASSGGDPRFYRLLAKIDVLHGRKNTDYAAGGKQGHLGNFIRVSEIKRLYPGLDWTSPLGTALDYMLKQLDAALILYGTKRDSITGEGVAERLQDVAVYALLGILLHEDEASTSQQDVDAGLRERLG